MGDALAKLKAKLKSLGLGGSSGGPKCAGALAPSPEKKAEDVVAGDTMMMTMAVAMMLLVGIDHATLAIMITVAVFVIMLLMVPMTVMLVSMAIRRW